jgi:hypothetical protein
MQPAAAGFSARFGIISVLLIGMLGVPHRVAGQSREYIVRQLTSDPLDHLSPANNNNGDIVWSQRQNGFSQIYILRVGSATPSALVGQQPDHNNQFPVIDDIGDVVYLKDGVGAGPGLVVARNSGGVENTIEFSSGNPPGCTEPPAGPPTCTSFRGAGQHFGISSGGTTISYFDFSTTGARRFDVSGVGTLQCGAAACDFRSLDFPDINNNGDFVYSVSGQVKKSSVTSPSTNGTVVAPGILGRITNFGDVVVVSGGGVSVYLAPDYKNSRFVHTGTWAGINDLGVIAFQDVDSSGHQQIYEALPQGPQGIDLSIFAVDSRLNSQPSDFWAEAQKLGVKFAVVEGFAGKTDAGNFQQGVLSVARSYGVQTATYCELNFNAGAQSGHDQITNRCLPNLGSEQSFLKFVAIAVENDPNLIDSSTNSDQRIQIIADAIKAVMGMGKIPIIYTLRDDWLAVTNNTSLFAGIPLWDSHSDGFPALDLDVLASNLPAAWVPYGGWSSRLGKQYDVGSPNDCGSAGGGTNLFGVCEVDLDIFASSLFSGLPASNTLAGQNVSVQPVDDATGTTPVTISFANVQQPGTTTVASSNSGPPTPSGFLLGVPPTYYDVSTTAVFGPTVLVCINYSQISFTSQANLRLLHFENGTWVDQTISLDPMRKIICGIVSSLSPFAVVEPQQGDTTPPTSNSAVSPTPNAAGWNNTNAAVTLTSTDNEPGGTGVKQIQWSLSGAQTGSSTVPGGTTTVTISAEGTTTLTFFGTDNAGNQEAPKTLTIQIDKTPPSISGARTPAANANGWNNTNVTVRFQCADSLSGLAAGSPPAPTVLSAEGAAQSVRGTCTDAANNSATATVNGINVDKTPPVITASANPATLWPPNGKMVPITISGTMEDNLSGVNSSTAAFAVKDAYGLVQPSGPVSLASNGTYSFTFALEARRDGQDKNGRLYTIVVSTEDNAGNASSSTTTVIVPHDQGN